MANLCILDILVVVLRIKYTYYTIQAAHSINNIGLFGFALSDIAGVHIDVLKSNIFSLPVLFFPSCDILIFNYYTVFSSLILLLLYIFYLFKFYLFSFFLFLVHCRELASLHRRTYMQTYIGVWVCIYHTRLKHGDSKRNRVYFWNNVRTKYACAQSL